MAKSVLYYYKCANVLLKCLVLCSIFIKLTKYSLKEITRPGEDDESNLAASYPNDVEISCLISENL